MKEILISLCLATTLALNVTDSVAQKGKSLYSFPLGVQAYTYRNSFPKSVVATLDTIKALGITEIEAGAPRGMTPEEFRKLCDERGIKIPSTGAGYERTDRQSARRSGCQSKSVGSFVRDGLLDSAPKR